MPTHRRESIRAHAMLSAKTVRFYRTLVMPRIAAYFCGASRRLLKYGLGLVLVNASFPLHAQLTQYPSATLTLDEASGNQFAFDQVNALLAAGAYGLAERHLINQRPPISRKAAWMRWEQRLWSLYLARSRWQALIERISSLPADLPARFLHEAGVNQVAAHLKLNQPEKARELAVQLLWKNDVVSTRVAADIAANLRRLIVSSYLVEGLSNEARIASLRFQREFNPTDETWLSIYARTLLKTGRPDLVTRELASSTLPSMRQLLAISRLRDGSLTPNQVIDLSLPNARSAESDDKEARNWWSIVAEAAKMANNPTIRVLSLEEALSLPSDASTEYVPVDISTDALLAAYDELVVSSDLKSRLVEDDEWISEGDRTSGDFPAVSRAIFAYVARNGLDLNQVELANGKLALSLVNAGMERLMFRLYGNLGAIAGFQSLPDELVYSLADQAIEKSLLRRAAALTKHLKIPPNNISPDEWQLRQARLAIFSKDIDRANRILQEWIMSKPQIAEDEADRMLQLVFDLQAIDEHVMASALLAQLHGQLAAPRQKREVYFWKADSLMAQKQYESAAENYLASASTFGDINDLWGQSARVKAADAMLEAGLIDDARSVYQTLLDVTTDRARRSELTQRLQKLWLKQPVENSLTES